MMQAGLSGSSELHLCECDIEGFVLLRSTPQSQRTGTMESSKMHKGCLHHLQSMAAHGLKTCSTIRKWCQFVFLPELSSQTESDLKINGQWMEQNSEV